MSENDDSHKPIDRRIDGTKVPNEPKKDSSDPVDAAEAEFNYRLKSGLSERNSIQFSLAESARRNELTDHERLITIDAWVTFLDNEYITNQAVRYADPYPVRREVVRERDDYECQICGLTESEHGEELQIHHITPPEVMDDKSLHQSPYNLISACGACHGKIEGMSRIETLRRCRNPDHLRSSTDE